MKYCKYLFCFSLHTNIYRFVSVAFKNAEFSFSFSRDVSSIDRRLDTRVPSGVIALEPWLLIVFIEGLDNVNTCSHGSSSFNIHLLRCNRNHVDRNSFGNETMIKNQQRPICTVNQRKYRSSLVASKLDKHSQSWPKVPHRRSIARSALDKLELVNSLSRLRYRIRCGLSEGRRRSSWKPAIRLNRPGTCWAL